MQDWLLYQAVFKPNDYSEEAYHSFKTAAYLAVEGVKRGDRVGILGSLGGIEFHALRILGAVAIPFNMRLSAEEILWQAKNVNCDYIFAPRFISEKAQILAENGFKILTDDYESAFTYIFRDENHAKADMNPFLDKSPQLDSPAAIIHTSGTSGKPKGAVLTYGNFFYSAMASAYRIGHLPDDKWLCVLPLYHVGGLSILLRAVLNGTTVDLRPKFDVDEINHALSNKEISLVSLVPTMLYRLLEKGTPEKWKKLRLILLGGAAASIELLEECRARKLPVATTYGLTEACSQVATALPHELYAKMGTVGKPLMFTELKIVDEQGKPKKAGDYGEILVKGPTVMQGYYNNPEATAQALRDGWLHTGDIGYLDSDGDLFLVQRRSDLIVSGGENIYPAEIEAILRQHPAVKEAVVIGLEDAEWGQKVAAAIQLRDGQFTTEAELIAFARQQLAGYKIPRIIKFVSEFPMTGSGKIQRGALRGLFEGA
jgi:o-succinylbenzoate---CoA ligase